MPVMHSAQVFPRFFTTDRELGIAVLPLDWQIQALMENRTFPSKEVCALWGSLVVGLVATAAIAASVTASALALSAKVQTMQTVNDLSARVTSALDRQAMANSQI